MKNDCSYNQCSIFVIRLLYWGGFNEIQKSTVVAE